MRRGRGVPLRCFFSSAIRASRPDTYLVMKGSSMLGMSSLITDQSSSVISEGQFMFLIRACIVEIARLVVPR